VLKQLMWLRSGDTWCAEGFIREARQQLTSLSLDVDTFWDCTLHLLSELHGLQELTLHRFQCRQMRDWVVHGELVDFSNMTVSKLPACCRQCACAADYSLAHLPLQRRFHHRVHGTFETFCLVHNSIACAGIEGAAPELHHSEGEKDRQRLRVPANIPRAAGADARGPGLRQRLPHGGGAGNAEAGAAALHPAAGSEFVRACAARCQGQGAAAWTAHCLVMICQKRRGLIAADRAIPLQAP
jgi:hypothetical protein